MFRLAALTSIMTILVPFVIYLLDNFIHIVRTTIPKYDTIVVGLGAAGATAASTLAQAGRRVLALEALERVGGRVCTETFADGVVELGAEWIHGLYPSRVYDLAVQHIRVELQDLPLEVHRSDGSGGDGTLTELFLYCSSVLEQVSDRQESQGQMVERKLREYLAEKNPDLLKDEKLVERFLELVNQAVNMVHSSDSYHEVSAQSGFQYLNGSRFGSWHRHGYKTFFDILLNTFNNGPGLPTLDMKLKTVVSSIQWSDSGVVVTCADGEQYSADNVIVTVSLGVLKERHASLFSPPLPPEKVAAIESMSMGVLDKVVVQLERPLDGWDRLVFFYWSAEDVAAVPEEDRWITKFVASSPQAGADNAITLWIAGNSAKIMESLPVEVVQSKAVEVLQRFSGDVTVSTPVSTIRSKWFSNRYSRGSYSFDNMDTLKHPGLRRALAEPLAAGGAPRVLFAGEATSEHHYLTVHGATETGSREAERLLGK